MRLPVLLALAASPLLSAPALADCADDIRDIMARSLDSGPYHIETTVTSPAGDVAMTGEIVPPTGMHVKTVTGGMTTEMTFIDGKGWMQMAGTWTELPPEVAGTMTDAFSPKSLEVLAGMTDAQCLGEQSFDGGSGLQFSYAYAVAGIDTQTTLYADPATKLPVRLESRAEISGMKTETVANYRYDAAIKLTPPAM
jgi:hypothetical protein